MYRNSFSKLSLTIIVLLLFFTFETYADKGGWPVKEADISITESGQRAIIGWDGIKEVLCLGTDVSSSKQTTVIEFIPLPSKPEVSLADPNTFKKAEELLKSKGLYLYKYSNRLFWRDKSSGGQEGEPFVITFHEKMGAHDITVVEVKKPNEFFDWIKKKAEEITGNEFEVPRNLRHLIHKYYNEYKCPYYVFDVIDVGPDTKSVEPVVYEFAANQLYYPLEISSTFHGETEINLVILAENMIDFKAFVEYGFLISNSTRVTGEEMAGVSDKLQELLGGSAYISAFLYKGDIQKLKGNLNVGLYHSTFRYNKKHIRNTLYGGILLGASGGLLLALICLWPLRFIAQRQKTKWYYRLLAGLSIGLPLGYFLSILSIKYFSSLHITDLFYFRKYALVSFYMAVGFILFTFQLGLSKKWPFWFFVYLLICIPLFVLLSFEEIEDLFRWYGVFVFFANLNYISALNIIPLLMLVVAVEFFAAKIFIWIIEFFQKKHLQEWIR